MSVHIPATGWAAWVEDSTTDRIIPAEVLDDPEITPSLNTLPEIRLPVPKSDVWQGLDGRPTMAVYRDGAEQPIDELTEPTDPKDAAHLMLAGQGGVELLEVIEAEFDAEERQEAAKTIINDHTSYDSDVPEPDFPLLEDEDLQDPEDTADFNGVTSFAADEPATVGTDVVELEQTNFFIEAEDFDDNSGTRGTIGSEEDNYSDSGVGVAAGRVLENTGDYLEWDVTFDHDVPADDVGIQVREGLESGNQDAPAFTWTFNGNELDSLNTAGTTLGPLSWEDIGSSTTIYDDGNGYTGGDLSAGTTYTLRVEVDDGGDAGDDLYFIDGVSIYDEGDRFNGFTYTFDNDTDANDALDGPAKHPENGYDVVFNDAFTAFSLIAATVTVSMDDTGGDQRVQLSNDRGANWLPDDGTEDNTSSVTIDPFSNASDRVRLRVRLDPWEPSGAASTTPKFGYDTQTIQSYDLDADIEQTSLVLDYSEEQSIEDHLSQIVGGEFVWSYRIVDGTKTVSVLQPDARTSGSTPKAVDAKVSKDLQTFEQFTVRGANSRVVGEPFDASASFENLTETNIRPGTETVTDPTTGTNYERTEDYDINWQDGEIRAVSDGDLAIGDDYEITYRHDVQGTYPDDSALASDARSRTVDIPAVTSSRNAEQIAYVLVEVDGFNAPRWVADVQVPPTVATFDAIEALPVSDLDIPASAGPLEIEEPPAVTPEGIAFRLGTRRPLEDRLSELRSRVRQVARRSG